MSCALNQAKPDWNAYVLGEMDRPARQQAEGHAAVCAECQQDVTALRMTLDSMAALRDEEIPRRIAFVSDKVFEPRWWRKMFLRPSFAGAALIAAAVLAHGVMRPPVSSAPPVDVAAMEARVSEKLQAQMADSVQAAVAKAVAATREQDDRRTALLLASAERRYMESTEILNKQVTRIYAMNSGAGVR